MFRYNSALKLHPRDSAIVSVASNNILVLNRDRDVFDSKKRVKVLASEDALKKLTKLQKQHILFNRCLFALQTNQLEQCRELKTKLKTTAPNSDLAVLAEVALLFREKKVNSALELLQNHLVTHSDAGVKLYAFLSQLYLSTGNMSQVCSTLHNIPSLSRYVGVVSTLALLYSSEGELEKSIEVLQEMLGYWLEKSDALESFKTNLVVQVAEFLLARAKPEAAASVLERLLKERRDDLKLRALLISAYSQYNADKAEEVSRDLPPFQANKELDVETIEQMPLFRHSHRPAAERAEVRS